MEFCKDSEFCAESELKIRQHAVSEIKDRSRLYIFTRVSNNVKNGLYVNFILQSKEFKIKIFI
jgi:hypothetical protein